MTERVIQKVLASREDLALGQGTVEQTRNGVPTTVSLLDLAWVVTSVADLQLLDTSLYFHAVVDTSTTTINYRFDALSAEIADGYRYVDPAVGAGQWVLVTAVNVDIPVMPTYTVASLPAAASNTRGLVYVSDETGGATLAFSNGTNWLRVQDLATVS